MGVVFYTDYRYRTIINPIVFAILLVGIYQNPNISLLYNVGFAFMFFLPFWATGGLGGGDYKLMMALAALIGVYSSMVVFILGAVPCLVYSVIKKLFQNKELFYAYQRDIVFNIKMVSMGQLSTAAKLSQGESVPLGCWLAFGYYVWLIGGVII